MHTEASGHGTHHQQHGSGARGTLHRTQAQAHMNRRQTHQHTAQSIRYLQYTDGAWDGESQEEEMPDLTAGWGVAALECVRRSAPGALPMAQIAVCDGKLVMSSQHAKLVSVKSGAVQDDHKEPDYIGAIAHTNNTGELTAMYEALAAALQRPRDAGGEIIWSDSLYAINMTTGKWRPKCVRNREIVSRLRGLWRRLQRARPGDVQIRHVRSHVKIPGNELADWLADCGKHARPSLREAERWLADWIDTQQRAALRMTQRQGGRGDG